MGIIDCVLSGVRRKEFPCNGYMFKEEDMFGLINITSYIHALKHLGTSLTVKTLKDLFQSTSYSGKDGFSAGN